MKRLVFPGVLGTALYFSVAGGEYSALDVRQAESRLESGRSELARARHEIDSLRTRIDALENDEDALERFARERYGFIRDGEYLYRISDADDSAQPDRRSRSPALPREGLRSGESR